MPVRGHDKVTGLDVLPVSFLAPSFLGSVRFPFQSSPPSLMQLSDPNPRVTGWGDLRLVLLIFGMLFRCRVVLQIPGGRAEFAGSGGCRGGGARWSGRGREGTQAGEDFGEQVVAGG